MIAESVDGSSVRSTLQLPVPDEVEGTGFFCRGDNGFISTDSDTAFIIPISELLTLLISSDTQL